MGSSSTSSAGSSRAELWQGVAEGILGTPGTLPEATRRAIAAGDDPAELVPLLAKVRRDAYKIVDSDVAGLDEDAVIEAALAAALTVSLDRRAAALAAIEDAAG
ncbi:MAG TPA: hypothetical protein VJ986_02745 [Gaiellaceae bacterium]|nr:hypothetical protein [Gaiellaceae bacterium]